MLQHFQFKSLYADERLPGWTISFYFSGHKYEAVYHPDGEIEWHSQAPAKNDATKIQNQIHELMLYHVYNEQR